MSAEERIQLSAHRFNYPIGSDLAFIPACSVLSPSGRTLFSLNSYGHFDFLAIELIAGRTIAFKVPDHEGSVQIHLHPIDDTNIFLTFNLLYDDDPLHNHRQPNDTRLRNLFRFRLDYANKKLTKTGEWQCETSAQQNADLNTSHATLIRILSPHYTADHTNFTLYLFDNAAERFHRVEARFRAADGNVARPKEFFEEIASNMSNMHNGQFHTFMIGSIRRNFSSNALGRFIEMHFTQLFRLDLLTGNIERLGVANCLRECLALGNAGTLDALQLFNIDGQWMDEHFCLKIPISQSIARPATLYVALFDVRTLRWRRIFVDAPTHLKLLSEGRFKMCMPNGDALIMYNERRHTYELSEALRLKSVDIFRMPLRKPDSLKMLCMLRLHRAHGRSGTKWRRISNAFREFLK